MPLTVSEPRLAWSRHGTGNPVVLVNPIGGQQASWLLTLRDLTLNFTLVTYDLRGTGGSALPPRPRRGLPTDADPISAHVADLVRLLDELSVAEASFVGHGFGARVLMALGLAHPERVRHLILVSASGAGPLADPEMRSLLLEHPADESVWRERMIPQLCGEAWRAREPDRVANLARLWSRRRPDPAAHAALWEAHDRFDIGARLADLRRPTLLLHGTADTLVPIRHAEALFDGLPEATLVRLDGVGHHPELEASTLFGVLIRDFMLQRGQFMPVVPEEQG